MSPRLTTLELVCGIAGGLASIAMAAVATYATWALVLLSLRGCA